jgi:phosphoglycerate dehydrogenase-like enzyme
MTAPRIAIGPEPHPFALEAVTSAGGTVVGIDESPDGLVWLDPAAIVALGEALRAAPGVEWVQLPYAGIEPVVEAGLLDPRHRWTCAKGAYAEPVAEHALLLSLAGLRGLKARAEAKTWGKQAGLSLYDRKVTVLGGGGITTSLLGQLAPFRVEATVVRRSPDPVPGAARTVTTDRLHEVLPGASVVILALALSPATTGIIGAEELALMDDDAVLVNVARGRHVDTDALVAALTAGAIGYACLDVTDPEPLPDGHPLWSLPNCLVTPHTADTWDMIRPLLGERIRINVERFGSGGPLVGQVDVAAGY